MSYPVENRAGLPADRFAALAAVVGEPRSIKRVLDWSLSLTPPVAPADVVAQDEFSHDVLIGLNDPPGCWLVYACEHDGVLTAAAVWDHLPTPDELLDARLARGWVPQPSNTQGGPVILGHAATRIRSQVSDR